MLARSLLTACFVAAASATAFFGCGQVLDPANKPIDTCVRACKARASRSCSDGECMRGCEFVLDRLVEREGENVIACVARTPRRCTDTVWADCAVKVGVHADGGPPPPLPPQEED